MAFASVFAFAVVPIVLAEEIVPPSPIGASDAVVPEALDTGTGGGAIAVGGVADCSTWRISTGAFASCDPNHVAVVDDDGTVAGAIAFATSISTDVVVSTVVSVTDVGVAADDGGAIVVIAVLLVLLPITDGAETAGVVHSEEDTSASVLVPILGRDAVSVDTAEASALKERGIGRGGGPIAAADVKRSVSFRIIARNRACWSEISRATIRFRSGGRRECLEEDEDGCPALVGVDCVGVLLLLLRFRLPTVETFGLLLLPTLLTGLLRVVSGCFFFALAFE